MKGKALTHTRRHVIHMSSIISARGHFLNACSCCLTSGLAFPSFARSPISPGHTSEKCQPTSGNRFLKRARLCYLCVDTLLKEPLDWKHSTGKRNGTSHPAPASPLPLWGMSVGNTTLSLAARTLSGEVGLSWPEVFITKAPNIRQQLSSCDFFIPNLKHNETGKTKIVV